MTHMKRLTDMDRGVARYYESIAPLAESPKLGPVLWQLPDHFAATRTGSPTRSRTCRRAATRSSSATSLVRRARVRDPARVRRRVRAHGDHPERPTPRGR